MHCGESKGRISLTTPASVKLNNNLFSDISLKEFFLEFFFGLLSLCLGKERKTTVNSASF